jgi:hypothetical protein
VRHQHGSAAPSPAVPSCARRQSPGSSALPCWYCLACLTWLVLLAICCFNIATTTILEQEQQGLGEEEEAEIDFVAPGDLHIEDDYGQALAIDDEAAATASDEDVGGINEMDLDID